ISSIIESNSADPFVDRHAHLLIENKERFASQWISHRIFGPHLVGFESTNCIAAACEESFSNQMRIETTGKAKSNSRSPEHSATQWLKVQILRIEPDIVHI